jgi:hypothetical protein
MNGSTLCVGADVHKNEIQPRLLDLADGHEVGPTINLNNYLPGTNRAIATLVHLMTQQGYGRLDLAFEATGLLRLP